MSKNPLTNQNYINKDFQTIYPELLDLVKQLSYKWDPTISNESDPGVVLLKLNAILADKNNYNIDKNILECFPDTVTQYDNAYKLFGQLGYNMHWYRSAKGEISFRWNDEKLYYSEGKIFDIIIPQFTMVSDTDKEIVYTTLDVCHLPADESETVVVNAIQGVVRDFTVGGSTLIKASMLDYQNRLYFPISNVAENGVFISDCNKNGAGEHEFVWNNPDTTGLAGWKSVDNLYIQPLNTKCYKFGVDQTTNSCYIEFPNDITDLMGEGIFIKYIQSDGALGNIAAKRITQFYNDYSYEYGTSGNTADIDVSTNTKVTNFGSITNGLEPETIDDAYVNYQRQVGTFDTLVTLRDYLNFIINDEFEQVSNGVVSDRTNDVQSSYTIINTYNGETTTKNIVCVDDDGNKEMDAFALKTYFLEYSPFPKFSTDTTVDDQKLKLREAYDKSFNFKLNNAYDKDALSTSDAILNLYSNSKNVHHDFIDKLSGKILFIKNKFDLNLTIIPNNMVTQSQANDIEKSIYEAVLKQLCAKNINFGEELTYEKIYDICNNTDSRVKAVALDNIEYEAYAVMYFDKEDLQKMSDEGVYVVDKNNKPLVIEEGLNEIYIPNKITSESTYQLNEQLALEICAKNILSGTTPLYHPNDSFQYSLEQSDINIIHYAKEISTYNEIEFNNLANEQGSFVYMKDGTEEDSKMLENESLFLYSPSLIDDISYSTGSKYVYITDNTYIGTDTDYIPANTDYKLSRGQYLFIFWKTEDSDDASYQYIKYEPGTILHASTRLFKYKDEKSVETYNELCAKLTASGYSGEGQIFGDLNDKIKDISDTILSVNKKITVKRVNSVQLYDPNNYCYWVTKDLVNDNGKDKYRITFDYVSQDGEYISQSYQNGYMYASNFAWGGDDKDIDASYTLEDGKIIYILEPIPRTIRYTDKNRDTQQYSEQSISVTEYKLIAKLEKGCTIKCTGNIYKMDDIVLSTLDSFNIGNTLSWGTLETSRTESKVQYPFYSDKTQLMSMSTFADSVDKDCFGTTYKLEYNIHEGDNPSWKLTKEGVDLDIKITLSEDVSLDGVSKYKFTIDGGKELISVEPTIYAFKPGDFFLITMMLEEPNMSFYNTITVSDDSYKTPSYNKVATLLDFKSHCLLKGGYKIDVVTDRPEQEDSTFTYTLKENEHFMYTDDTKKSLYILEKGTTISLITKTADIKYLYNETSKTYDSLSYYVDAVSMDTIYEEGEKTFTDETWYNFKCNALTTDSNKFEKLISGTMVGITENQILIMPENTYLRVKQNTIEIPSYKDGEYTTSVIYDRRFANLKISSDGIEASDGNGEWHRYKGLLNNYTIQYKDVESEGWTDLPAVGDESLAWDGYTILNVNTSTKPQKLDKRHKQKFIVTQVNNGSLYGEGVVYFGTKEIDSTEQSNPPTSDYVIQTTHPLNFVGGNNIDVTGITFEKEIIYPDVMYYRVNDITDNSNIKKVNDDYEITLNDKAEILDSNILSTIMNVVYFKESIDNDCIGNTYMLEFIANSDWKLSKRGNDDFTCEVQHVLPDGDNKSYAFLGPDGSSFLSCGAYSNGYDFKPGDHFLISIKDNDTNEVYFNPKYSVSIECDIPDNIVAALEFADNNALNKDFSVQTATYDKFSDTWSSYTTIHPINSDAIMGKKETYYLQLPSCQKIRFSVSDTIVDEVMFKVKPLFKYDYTIEDDKDKQVNESLLLSEVNKWNVDNLFNYTYEPEFDSKIYNPLAPKNYFNVYHKYNAFTIPQINKLEIKTMNKRS